MPKGAAASLIRLRGVRHNNLKNFDLDLPIGRLIVITGLSGSGKSSLAFDTLYAEGQRRYIETFSPYARQFFERMDKPQVDSIQGIPPAIAVEQRNSVRSTRSTVGTMTELCEYMKVVWAHVAQLHCRQCGQPVSKESPQAIWRQLTRATGPGQSTGQALIAFTLPLSDKLSIDESLQLIAKQGYQRILLPVEKAIPEIVRIEDASQRLGAVPEGGSVTVLQDRLAMAPSNRVRFIEACEQAYHFGKGKLAVFLADSVEPWLFSNRLHCAACNLEYPAPSPALFSFNHPVGACPTCRGFGRTITIDYSLAIPDPTLSIAQGVVKPWQTGQSAECQRDLMQFCRKRKAPIDVPYQELSTEWKTWLLEGDPGYGKDAQNEWPHAWYGIKGYFRWLESKSYKMHVRVLLSRYRTYQSCPACAGRRFQPEALLFKHKGKDGHLHTLSDFYQMPVSRALRYVQSMADAQGRAGAADAFTVVLGEVSSRLRYLEESGLGYLTLDRPTRSLSGGETERVNLTTCLGSRLVNTLFVLDEPSVGLHPRDTKRLVEILARLRDTGNTVVVVEHERSVMEAADHLVDLGPGHGAAGGALVFQGSYQDILKSKASITGKFLSGEAAIPVPARRPIRAVSTPPGGEKGWVCPSLTIRHARCHNLKDLTVQVPLERLVCLTGVSGSGKTTLIRDVLLPQLTAMLGAASKSNYEAEAGLAAEQTPEAPDCPPAAGSPQLLGWERLDQVVLVDQSALGRTPRSNPAVYIGAFDHIRELFSQSEPARQRGLNASAFSFNSAQGQCELCRGAGFEKVEMQFLSDIFIRCPSCEGRRYRQHILEVKISAGSGDAAAVTKGLRALGRPDGRKIPVTPGKAWSIADLLDATVDESIAFLETFAKARAAMRAVERLKILQDVGLGYLRLGQPINTLSGGESQRLKLVSHLADFAEDQGQNPKRTLFLFDEPTTGLHFADVKVLLEVFQRLVDQGHSVLVIEHNLDLIKCADWLIDLGPEGGEEGGYVVGEGTPEELMTCPQSHTGACLRAVGLATAAKHPAGNGKAGRERSSLKPAAKNHNEKAK